MALTGAVGAINVKVSADATGFNASMNKVGSKVAATSKRVRASANTYAKWGAVAATAALTVGAAMVKNQMKVLDALAKTSDALGVQQKQLQALQHVAELTGTGAAQLSVNLERMQRRIGEVARKGGQAAAALSEIGVSASEMIELPADQQLVRISQAMVGVTNSSIKASIAMDLFGRDGVRMLKMMEQLGQNGIAPTVAELEALGVSLSRLDTAKVEQANDALFRTKQVTDGVVNQIAIKLSPLITQMGEDFLNAAKEGEGFGSTIDSVMSKSAVVVGVFADALHGIKIIFKGLEIAGKTMGLAVVKVMQGALLGVQMFIDKSISSINNLIDNINVISGAGISSIERFELGAVQSFANLAESGKEQIASLVTEMHNMAMTQLPSDQFDAWVAKAEAAATAAATAATTANGDGSGSTVGLSDADKVKMQEKLTAISQSLMSETELKRLALENDAIVLKEALDNKLILQTEHDEKLLALVAQTNGEMTAIEEKAARDKESINARTESAIRSMQAATVQNAIGLLDAFAGKSKAAAIAALALSKGLAIAQTIQNTGVAVMAALAVDPTGVLAARAKAMGALNVGMIAATGLVQAASISSGGASSMTNSGGMPAQRTTSGGGSSGGGMGDRNISISGLDPSSMFSGEQVRDLLKNMAGDGADFTFLTSGG